MGDETSKWNATPLVNEIIAQAHNNSLDKYYGCPRARHTANRSICKRSMICVLRYMLERNAPRRAGRTIRVKISCGDWPQLPALVIYTNNCKKGRLLSIHRRVNVISKLTYSFLAAHMLYLRPIYTNSRIVPPHAP